MMVYDYETCSQNSNICFKIRFALVIQYGSFIFRLGRKFALMTSILIYIGSNIALSFVNKFEVFTTLRFFSGVSVGGLITACYVMGKSVFLLSI